MKKILMTIAAAFVAVSMSAQVYVGGSLGFTSTSYQQDGVDSDTHITILPEIGYNLDDNFAIGASFGYESYSDNDKYFAINPYARYTFAKFDNISLFVDGGLNFKSGKDGNDFTELGIGFKPGIAVNLTDKISFVSHLGFLGFKEYNPEGDDNNRTTFGFDMSGMNLNFGLYFNF